MRLLFIYYDICHSINKKPVLQTEWELLMEILHHNNPCTRLGKDRDYILYLLFDKVSDYKSIFKFELNQIVSALIQSINRNFLNKLLNENDLFKSYKDANECSQIFNTLDYLTILGVDINENDKNDNINNILITYQKINQQLKKKYFKEQKQCIY